MASTFRPVSTVIIRSIFMQEEKITLFCFLRVSQCYYRYYIRTFYLIFLQLHLHEESSKLSNGKRWKKTYEKQNKNRKIAERKNTEKMLWLSLFDYPCPIEIRIEIIVECTFDAHFVCKFYSAWIECIQVVQYYSNDVLISNHQMVVDVD